MSWFRAAEHRQDRQSPVDRPHPGPSGDPDTALAAGPPSLLAAADDRRVLIDLVIYAFDRARTPAVQQRLTAGLARVGVQVIRPAGGSFDPGSQEAGGVLPTADPALHNVIAETESAGFRDGDRIVREPVVVVYRLTPGGSSPE